jgi:hypothetical protein
MAPNEIHHITCECKSCDFRFVERRAGSGGHFHAHDFGGDEYHSERCGCIKCVPYNLNEIRDTDSWIWEFFCADYESDCGYEYSEIGKWNKRGQYAGYNNAAFFK